MQGRERRGHMKGRKRRGHMKGRKRRGHKGGGKREEEGREGRVRGVMAIQIRRKRKIIVEVVESECP